MTNPMTGTCRPINSSPTSAAPVTVPELFFRQLASDWALRRDKRIFSTGCSVENAKMTDCYYEKKDWRACKNEVSGMMRILELKLSRPQIACGFGEAAAPAYQSIHLVIVKTNSMNRWRPLGSAGRDTEMIRERRQRTLRMRMQLLSSHRTMRLIPFARC